MKVYSEKDINLQKKYTWDSRWVQPYESAWSIFNKFMYVNSMSRNQVMYTLGVRSVRNKQTASWSKSEGDLYFLESFDPTLIQTHLGTNYKKLVNAELCYLLAVLYKPSIENLFFSNFRYCHQCLSQGFHSIFHQFKLINLCPYHDSVLSFICPSCSRVSEYNFLNNSSKVSAYTCICGHQYISKAILYEFPKRWSQPISLSNKSSINKFLTLSSEEITRLRHMSYPVYRDLTPLANPIELLIDVVKKQYSENHIIFQHNPKKNSTINIHRPLGVSKDTLGNVSLTLSLRSTYKSISRHLRHKYFKKHKQCIANFRLNRYENNGYCPYAYAFAHWTGQIEGNYPLFEMRGNRKTINADMLDFFSPKDQLNLESIFNDWIDIKYDKKRIPHSYNYKNSFSINLDNLSTSKWVFNKVYAYMLVSHFHNWLEVAKIEARKEVLYTYQIPFVKYSKMPFYSYVFTDHRSRSNCEFHLWSDVNILLKSIPNNLECPHQIS